MTIAALRALPLPPRVIARLEALDTQHTAPVAPAAFRTLLAQHGYPAHDAVVAFEQAFGTLELEDPDDGPWLIGAAACVASDAHVAPRGGPGQGDLQLVPVIYTPNDGIAYIGVGGGGWFHDTIEEPDAAKVADSGAVLIGRIVLFYEIFEAGEREDGEHGARLAAELGLAPLSELSDDEERWWADETRLICERQGATWRSPPPGD